MNSLTKKIFFLLTKKQKIYFIYILSLVLVSVAFELLSLGMIIPILSSFFAGEIFSNKISLVILNFLGNPEPKVFLIYSLISILLIFLIKFFVVTFTIYSQYSYAFDLQRQFKATLYKLYINKDYSFFIKNSSSKLISVVLTQTDQLTSLFIIPVMFIILDGFILLGISIFLFFIEPFGMLITSIVFIILIYLYFIFLRKKLRNLGSEWKSHNEDFTKYLQQSFEGIRDTFLYQLEAFFNKKINYHLTSFTKPMRYFSTLQQVPRLALELLGVILLISFASSMLIFSNENSNNAFIKLTIFAAAAFKALPSINRLVYSVQSMNFSKNIIDPIVETIKNANLEKNQENKELSQLNKLNFDKKIFIKDLCFYYKKNLNILENVNLEINPCDKIGIIGKTGSGKSTFVDLFSGLITPQNGDIYLGNRSIYFNKNEWQRNISYVSQAPFFFEDTILNNIILNAKNYDINFLNNVINDVELKEFIHSLDLGLETIIGERGNQISGGQKQRISIARALYRKPKILILDESTSALDTMTQQKIVEKIIDRKKITTIFISHNLESLKFCNKIYELDRGNFIIKK